MNVSKIKLFICRQSFSTSDTFLKESTLKSYTISIPSDSQVSLKSLLELYARETLHLSGVVSCLPRLINYENRWKLVSRNWNEPVFSLVQPNSGHFSQNDTLVWYLNIFNVAHSLQNTLPEYRLDFYLKLHLINPIDNRISLKMRALSFQNQQLQKSLKDVVKYIVMAKVYEYREIVNSTYKL